MTAEAKTNQFQRFHAVKKKSDNLNYYFIKCSHNAWTLKIYFYYFIFYCFTNLKVSFFFRTHTPVISDHIQPELNHERKIIVFPL